MTEIADGIYLGMEPTDYFSVKALGSSDLIRLHIQQEGYWWSSSMNPDYKSKTTKAMAYGTALHTILLEGLKVYEQRYAVEPEWGRIAGLFDTIPEIKLALSGLGYTVTGQPYSAWKKEDWVNGIVDGEIDVPCKSAIMARFLRDIGNRVPINAVEDRMLRIMRDIALSNPDIGNLLQHEDFPALAEVSVFMTLPDGIRFRWRFDRLYPKFTMDLKSVGSWSGRPLAWAIGDLIAKSGYDIQRAHYHRGRETLYRFLAEGKISGGTLEQREWLAEFPERYPSFDWVWIFFQKPEPTGKAPVIFPVLDEVSSEIHTWGQRKADRALTFYRRMMRDFGPDKPWARIEPLHFTDEAFAPNPIIHLPHWIAAEELPTDADAWTDEAPE